jgi:transcriptional regulator with GAF, ATPase, and Fis domain
MLMGNYPMKMLLFSAIAASSNNLFRLGLALAVFYWLLETLLHAYLFEDHTLLEALLELHDPNEFWMRLVIVFLLAGFGYIAEGMRQREQKLNRLLFFLSDVNQHVQRRTDQQALFDAACRSAIDAGKFRFAWIGMKTGDDVKLAAWAAADPVIGKEINKLQQPEALICCLGCQRVLREGISGLCEFESNNDCAAPWLEPFLEQGCRHAIVMPLKLNGRTVGVFEVYAGEKEDFTREEKSILDEVADDVSVALGNIALEAERKHRAEDMAQRVEELERFQKATVQREFRIKELRDEIAGLKKGKKGNDD